MKNIGLEQNIIMRHADKGIWDIDKKELLEKLGEVDARIVDSVLTNDFPDLKSSPLKLEGIKRALLVAEKIAKDLAKKSVVLMLNSPSPRAQLTEKLIAAKIYFSAKEKQTNLAEIDAEQFLDILKDASLVTWDKYEKLMNEQGITEEQALATWMNDMQAENNLADPKIHPKEASGRYRGLVKEIRARITSESTPIVFVGVGHSGALAQIRMEQGGIEKATEKDAPDFCEIFRFDEEGNLILTEKTEIV